LLDARRREQEVDQASKTFASRPRQPSQPAGRLQRPPRRRYRGSFGVPPVH
jgi:hypothetical protein